MGNRTRVLACAVTLLCALTGAAVAAPGQAPGQAAAQAAAQERRDGHRLLVTSAVDDLVRLLLRRATDPGGSPVADVVVDTARPGRTWTGVGAALTDASLDVLEGRPDLVATLFDPGAAGGARLDWVRLPLSATDLSDRLWAWRLRDGRAVPPAEARRAVALLRDQVLPVNPALEVVASPWTAPPAMKQPRGWFGGSLRADRVRAYARLLVGQARWLRARGVPLTALTLANEPGHTADYPTMAVGDAELARLAALVGPALDRLGVELWGLDHNWADVGRLDHGTGYEHLDAVAFHCYAGQPAQVAHVPVPWLVTECTGTDDTVVGTFAWDSHHLVARSVAAGSTGLLMWNLVLPPGRRGAWGGCGTCRGLLTVDGDRVRPEAEFFTLAHLSRAAPAGSRVLPTSAPADLPTAAFARGRRIGLYGYNDSTSARTVRITLADGSTTAVHEVGPHEMFTWVRRR